MKRIALILAVPLLLILGMFTWGYAGAIADPIAREARIMVPGWPSGAPPVRVALISDLHVGGPDMAPERLARIVAQVNAARPDLVLIAGDLVSDKYLSTRRYSAAEAVAPLAALKPPLGVVAVLGNHDHWRGAAAFRAALPGVNVGLLDNQAIRRGPLTIVGLDDLMTGHADVAAAVAAADRLPGPALVLSHNPNVARRLPQRFTLLLAGHTHCEQVSLPLIGPLTRMSPFGCGITRLAGQTIVITAGLGTSILPIRIGVPSDYWILTLGA